MVGCAGPQLRHRGDAVRVAAPAHDGSALSSEPSTYPLGSDPVDAVACSLVPTAPVPTLSSGANGINAVWVKVLTTPRPLSSRSSVDWASSKNGERSEERRVGKECR